MNWGKIQSLKPQFCQRFHRDKMEPWVGACPTPRTLRLAHARTEQLGVTFCIWRRRTSGCYLHRKRNRLCISADGSKELLTRFCRCWCSHGLSDGLGTTTICYRIICAHQANTSRIRKIQDILLCLMEKWDIFPLRSSYLVLKIALRVLEPQTTLMIHLSLR